MGQPGTILNLASGGTVRVTPYVVEIRPPNTPAIPIDMQHVTGVGRDGRDVTIFRRNGDAMQLRMASLDDAGQLEIAVRGVGATQTPVSAPVVQRQFATSSEDSEESWPVRNRAVILVVTGIIVVFVIVGMLREGDEPSAPASAGNTVAGAAERTPTARVGSVATQPPSSYEVEYVVTLNRNAGPYDRAELDLVWNNATGGMERSTERFTPPASGAYEWRREFSMGPGEHAYLTATNDRNSPAVRTLRCELWIEGDLVESQEANGASGYVTCSSIVGR